MPTNKTASEIWKKRLSAASRIAVACIIVGCVNFYGPWQIRHQLKYPAFAYVTAILIVSEATLGHTLRGAWLAFIATLLVMGPSMTTLWLVGPENFKPYMAALAVSVGSFGVALAESAPLLAKRIAFGQMVLVFVGTVVFGSKAGVVMHPIHVAASTATGVVASILAMLIPFPRLANREVRKKCTAYTDNASQRIHLFVKAIVTEDSYEARLALDQIKTLSERAAILLHSIERNQNALLWETPHLRLLSRPNFKYPAEVLGGIELNLKAMETVLLSSPMGAPLDPQFKEQVHRVAEQLNSRIEQLKGSLPFVELVREPERRGDSNNQQGNSTVVIDATTSNLKHLPVLFFFLCTKCLFTEDEPRLKLLKDIQNSSTSTKSQKGVWATVTSFLPRPTHNNLRFAFKCSASLGLAVFFGLTYTTPNGYWSGLTIAISFVQGRFSTFSATNARAQGTALGSVYGLIAYSICHRLGALKLLSLIPWIIFTTFLRHSRIYGEAGSISAVIAALLILGRRNYGTPTEFAVARLTEAFIGLSCFIVVEVLMCPKRAAVLARAQLGHTAGTIDKLLEQMASSLCIVTQNKTDLISTLTVVEETKIQTRVQVNSLKRLIEEAKQEPNFWFNPFQGDNYTLVLNSVTKVADVLALMAYSTQLLSLDLMQRPGVEWKGYTDQLSVDLELFKRLISSPLKSIQQAMLPQDSSTILGSEDIEMAKFDQDSSNAINMIIRVPDIIKEEAEIVLGSFLKHTIQITRNLPTEEDSEFSNKLITSLGSVLFCMRSLVIEMMDLSMEVNELIRKENS